MVGRMRRAPYGDAGITASLNRERGDMGDYADAFAVILSGEIGCRAAFDHFHVGHAVPRARRLTARIVASPRSHGAQEPPWGLEAQG